MWLRYYLAYHHLYVKEYNEALEHIDAAIQHTPTVLELVYLKAKIKKHMGKMEEASKLYCEA